LRERESFSEKKNIKKNEMTAGRGEREKGDQKTEKKALPIKNTMRTKAYTVERKKTKPHQAEK